VGELGRLRRGGEGGSRVTWAREDTTDVTVTSVRAARRRRSLAGAGSDAKRAGPVACDGFDERNDPDRSIVCSGCIGRFLRIRYWLAGSFGRLEALSNARSASSNSSTSSCPSLQVGRADCPEDDESTWCADADDASTDADKVGCCVRVLGLAAVAVASTGAWSLSAALHAT
jgi:hypothetical protein